jgi:hypothetical protein
VQVSSPRCVLLRYKEKREITESSRGSDNHSSNLGINVNFGKKPTGVAKTGNWIVARTPRALSIFTVAGVLPSYCHLEWTSEQHSASNHYPVLNTRVCIACAKPWARNVEVKIR